MADRKKQILAILMALLLWVSTPFETAAGQDTAKGTRRYRIGYIERGSYWVFDDLMSDIKKAMENMGWKGRIEFPENARYSPGWKPGKDRDMARAALKIMGRKDIDLIIAAGTDATDAVLEVNNRLTPILSIAVSDPLGSGFVLNENDSGIDNYTVRIEPGLYRDMFKAFHEVVGFKKLGLIYADTKSGRQYANVEIVRESAKHSGFELIEYSSLSEAETTGECVKGINWLISQGMDAFYIPALVCFDWSVSDVKTLMDLLIKNRIPTFARQGTMYVKAGAMMGFASGFTGQAEFVAKNIIRILNGESPRSLNMIDNPPPRFSFNLHVANAIGFTPGADFLIIADEIFKEITLPEKKMR